MVWLLYFILLFNIGCFIFVHSDTDCMEFIAEKCQREGIFKTLMPLKPNLCVAACELVNTCFAVNYFLLNATCLLLNRTMPVSKLVKVTKCWYKSVRSPPKESIDNDPCYQIKCKWDEICMHNTTTHVAECYPLCKTPPAIPGTINETVEVEVGQNYTYRCQNGLFGKRDQNPTITCLRDGHWTTTNFTCVCNTPPAIRGAINETSEVEVGQNYTYRCQGGLFEKGAPNPTVTCQHDGSWTSTNFICVKQNWKQDTIYPNNIHKSDVISNMTGIDFLTCMQRCDDNLNNCLSFFYENHTSRCVLSTSFRRGLPQNFNFSDGIVYYTGWGPFLGMSDEANEGRWVSWDGKAVSPEWYPGEPISPSENCACIHIQYDAVASFVCDNHLRVLCHKKQL